MPLRIMQLGLGPIGLLTAEAVLGKAPGGQMELVGAVDVDPSKVGKDIAELLGADRPSGVVVRGDANRAVEELRPDVVLHTTSSFLERVAEQLETCLRSGAHVVSSTEELAFPFERHADLARHLDAVAEANGVVLVGTGVNPGYAMDALALAATGVCTHVRSIHVERVVDASRRRLPLLAKVGAGLSKARFEERAAEGGFGHIGLLESMRLVAHALGWTLDRTEESLEPVVAPDDVETKHMVIAEGDVAGIHHVVRGFVGDEAVLTLDLQMYVGADTPRDSIRVDGEPPIHLQVEGGIFGDTATAGALVNTAGVVHLAHPGLRTVAELPLPRAFGTTPGDHPVIQ